MIKRTPYSIRKEAMLSATYIEQGGKNVFEVIRIGHKEFAVTAMNAHDRLVNALRLLAGWIADDAAAVEAVSEALVARDVSPDHASAVSYLLDTAYSALGQAGI